MSQTRPASNSCQELMRIITLTLFLLMEDATLGCHSMVLFSIFKDYLTNFFVSGFGRIEIGLTRSWCVQQYVVVHEILHILGFGHEQSRPDRDQYITVNWDNMPVCSRLNFH